MVDNGVTCFRLNTAHSTPDELQKLVSFRDRLGEAKKEYISIMVDLKGPELRAVLTTDTLNMEAGKEYTLGQKETDSSIRIAVPDVIKTLRENDSILFMDGKIKTNVVKAGESQCVIKPVATMILKNNGRMNIPGKYIPMGILQPRDMEYLKMAIQMNVEYVALSFVQNMDEIDQVHDMIEEMNGTCRIIAKIETKQALDNLEGIVQSSDALMVARGDLGVEMPLFEVVISQKNIMRRSHQYGVPTIVATQMLESMVDEDTATRAEISDITNAILDDADCLMLSEESAIGKFPLQAVKTLRDTARAVESLHTNYSEPDLFKGSRITYSVSRSARLLSEEAEAHHIVVLTRSGNTARMVSSVRPDTHIIAVTPDKNVASAINLYRGITPFLLENFSKNVTINSVMDTLTGAGAVKKGERVVIVSGHPEHPFAGAAQVSLITVGSFIARGYASGKSISGKINEDIVGIFFGDMASFDHLSANGKVFKGYIFKGSVTRKALKLLRSRGCTCIFNTILLQNINDGDEVYIDTEIGSVYR
jgi:pyruvate kinase